MSSRNEHRDTGAQRFFYREYKKITEMLTENHKEISINEKEYNFISHLIIESAIEVHKELGPGLIESVYEYCLIKVLKEKGLEVKSQVKIPIVFRGEKLDKEFIIDVLVSNRIILELKSIEIILPVHESQLMTYLKLSGKKLGLLINFNSPLLKDGVRRRVNGDLEK